MHLALFGLLLKRLALHLSVCHRVVWRNDYFEDLMVSPAISLGAVLLINSQA